LDFISSAINERGGRKEKEKKGREGGPKDDSPRGKDQLGDLR
jgi:hypothetical protein